MDRYADNEVISRLLTEKSTWAVVGLSLNTSRAAYGVSARLARAASSGLEVVMDRCPAIEARRLGLTGAAW